MKGESLGFAVVVNVKPIRVGEILHDGVLGNWNRKHPNQQVAPGDCILEVNGIRSDDA